MVVFTAVTALPLTLLGALLAGTFGALMPNTDSEILSDHHGGAAAAQHPLTGRLPRRYRLAWAVLVLCISTEFSMTIWAGSLLFWSATTAWLALSGLLVMGCLGIAVQFPLSVARAIAAAEGRPDQANARLSIGAGLAIGLAPFLRGFLADQVGTRRAFLTVPVLLVLAGVALWSSRPTRAGGRAA